MSYEDLTDEQKAKVESCSTAEELVELARSEGVELTDDELAAVSGGGVWDTCNNYGCTSY